MQIHDGGSEQAEVFAFLGDPRTYGLQEPVARVDTHGAAVFLAGPDVYKVKRAVYFPFMDFSTLERRRQACEAEIAVNRPNAPDIYREVVAITRGPQGLELGGSGEAVEYAVRMRRFDETATLDRMAGPSGFSPELVAKLARAVLRSHTSAPRRDGAAATRALERYLEQNEAAFAADPALFDPERAARLASDARAALASVKPLLVARGTAGYVRRCHGDLHLRNIVLIDQEPVLFDAIEFDDAIATGDVLYDLAFLLMDLEERGRREAGNLLMNRYLWESGEEAQLSGLAALPIFLSIRSAIRAKVVAAGIEHLSLSQQARAREEAKRYFWFAGEFLKPAAVRLVAIGGLSGTGKSTLAARLAPSVGRSPGAVLLRSDIERKLLFETAETERLPQTAYDEAATREVYARLQRKAELALRAGQSAVVDAVHARPAERRAIERLAQSLGLAFTGLWLEVPPAVRRERVTARRNDASDADATVVAAQSAYDVGEVTWRRLDTSGDVSAVLPIAAEAVRAPTSPCGEEL
jgi:aminoglycoside phosphotransferase family enzyme/predicted kinase